MTAAAPPFPARPPDPGTLDLAPWPRLEPDAHEAAWNPRIAVPHFQHLLDAHAARNRAAREAAGVTLDIAFGEHRLRRLDLFPAATHRGCVHVFIHGGYWRGLDKQDFAFVAGALAARGVTTVAINYELCPDTSLDGVVESAIAAVRFVHEGIARDSRGDGALSLSGHSAGAHLVAEVLAHDWQAEGIDPAFIRGAVAISGIYDPAPAMQTTVNEQLRLTPALAARRDVLRRPVRAACPVLIAVGGHEPAPWVEQSFRYYHRLRHDGLDPALIVIPGRNHFDILDEFLAPTSALVEACITHCLDRPGSGHHREGNAS